jgi:hypothetical protein
MNLFFLVLFGFGCVHGNDGQNRSDPAASHPEAAQLPSAQAEKGNPAKLRVYLRDGSLLVGTTEKSTFPLKTSYGDLEMPFEKIRSVTFSDSTGGCAVEFSNGDIVHGKFGQNTLGFESTLGKLDLAVQSISRIFQAGRASAITDGLVAYYPLDGSLADATGHGHDGVNHGATPAPDRSGNPNHAYSFNGSGAYVALPDGLIDPNGAGFTISAWAMARSVDGERFVAYIGANSGEASLTAKDQQVRFIVNFSNHGGSLVAGAAELNKFVHLAGVYRKGKSISLYINGRLSGETPIPDDALVHKGNDHSSAIASYAPEQPNHAQYYHLWTWDGILDEIRIYNRALEPEEITALSLE